MKLKTYAEMDAMHKEEFYKWWYTKGKDITISVIESTLIDSDDYIRNLPYEILQEPFGYFERIYYFKYLRSELWNMGINLTKGVSDSFYIAKRKKGDKYSCFLTYYEKYSIYIMSEISQIQMITGKSREEAKKIFKAAWDLESPYSIKEEPKDTKKLYGKPVKKTKNNKTTVNVVNMTTEASPLEEANVTTDVTEALEQTLATDDSE